MRADARRNRERVIEAAFEAFRTEGLSVSIHEIARRAGVGTGTVCRHFHTKEALFEAVFLSRVDRLVEIGQSYARAEDAGEAFFAFFGELIAEATDHKGLTDALCGAGFDLDSLKRGSEHNLSVPLEAMLARAKLAGAVRPDVEIEDVKALVTGCLTRDACGRDRMISIARAGLRPSSSGPTAPAPDAGPQSFQDPDSAQGALPWVGSRKGP